MPLSVAAARHCSRYSVTVFNSALALALACAESNTTSRADSGLLDGTDDNSMSTDTADPDQDSGAALWWTLRAEIPIGDGLPQTKSASLTVTLLDADLAPVCEAAAPVLSIEPAEAPDPTIYAWWSLSTGPIKDCIYRAPELPDPLLLGVGAMHPELRAALSVSGEADPDALSGAYVSLDGLQTLLVFGAAGLPEAWEGDGAPADKTTPLADGSWSLRPVFTFRLSE
ncbi:MAG: hypothetical protein ACI8S6_000095 [Myxococcota bacterium]|jgi:hypothetical protein